MRWIVVPMFLMVACGPKGPPAIIGDETKSAAQEIRPNTTVDDKVSKADDPVDWKRFNVEERTPATITLYWDDPTVEAVVTLRDMFGGIVGELKHAPGAPKDSLAKLTLAEGTWFLEIRAEAGASVYTLEVQLGSDNNTLGVPRPE